MELRSGKRTMKYDKSDHTDKVMKKHRPVIEYHHQRDNIWGYLMNLGDTFINCVCYNILQDTTGKYAATVMSLCQLNAKHSGKFYIAKTKKRHEVITKEITHKTIMRWIVTMMMPLREQLEYKDYIIRRTNENHKLMAIPILSRKFDFYVTKAVIYISVYHSPFHNTTKLAIPLRLDGEDTTLIYADTHSRLDAWYTIANEYSFYKLYVHNAVALPWMIWSTCNRHISYSNTPSQHKDTEQCSTECWTDNWTRRDYIGHYAMDHARKGPNRYSYEWVIQQYDEVVIV